MHHKENYKKKQKKANEYIRKWNLSKDDKERTNEYSWERITKNCKSIQEFFWRKTNKRIKKDMEETNTKMILKNKKEKLKKTLLQKVWNKVSSYILISINRTKCHIKKS